MNGNVAFIFSTLFSWLPKVFLRNCTEDLPLLLTLLGNICRPSVLLRFERAFSTRCCGADSRKLSVRKQYLHVTSPVHFLNPSRIFLLELKVNSLLTQLLTMSELHTFTLSDSIFKSASVKLDLKFTLL